MVSGGSWIDFWNRPNAIYANQRNLEVHFASLRDDLLPHIPQGGTVLDYGCGDALTAPDIAARCGALWLYDAAPVVRERLRARYSGRADMRVLDDADIEALPSGGVDLITIVSVVQYIPRHDLPGLLARLKTLLAPGGRLLIADIVPPDAPLLRDVASQLSFAWKNGFLVPALLGIARLALSDYRDLRRDNGFSVYTVEEMLGLLRAAGLTPERVPRNIGPTVHRNTVVGRNPG